MAEEAGSVTQFEAYRGLLFSIAYRMLGSAAEAEDLVQDAYIRFASSDRDVVRDVKAFLVTILTRLALDRLKSAQARRETYIGPWLPEPVLTGSDADPFASATRAEEIEIALVAAMEKLTPQERAVFLLAEVLEHDHAEIAEILGITASASRQLLHRARERMAEGKKRFHPSREEQERLLAGFMAALRDGNVDALREVLASDVVAFADGGGKVPGAGLHPILGFDKVARLYLALTKQAANLRIEIGQVNGALALVGWAGDRLQLIVTFGFDGDRIAEIATVLNPDKLAFASKQFVDSASR